MELSKENIKSIGWNVSTESEHYMLFENKQKCIFVWWKHSNHCELEREEEYDMGYRGKIDDMEDLQFLMKKLEIFN